MTVAEMQAVVARIAYRPGWSIAVEEHEHEGAHIRIVCTVEDSYHPGSTIDLGITSAIPPMRSEEQLVDWMLWRLKRIEEHEVREWLRFDGEVWSDPHAG